MTTEELRESIAQEMDKAICEYDDVPMTARWEKVGPEWKRACREKADRILLLFAEAQREALVECLTWLTKEGWIAYPGEVLNDLKAYAELRYPGSRQGGV